MAQPLKLQKKFGLANFQVCQVGMLSENWIADFWKTMDGHMHELSLMLDRKLSLRLDRILIRILSRRLGMLNKQGESFFLAQPYCEDHKQFSLQFELRTSKFSDCKFC